MISSRDNRHARIWRLVLPGILLLGAAGAGAWWWFPVAGPPDIPVAELDAPVREAVAVAQAAVTRQPRSAAAWGTLGLTLLANELYPEIGLVCFQHAQRLDPKNPRWPFFAGGELVNLGRREQAVPELEHAMVLAEQSGEGGNALRLVLAETLMDAGQADAAERYFREVLARDLQEVRHAAPGSWRPGLCAWRLAALSGVLRELLLAVRRAQSGGPA